MFLNPSELCFKSFYFRIKGFCRGICTSVNKVVEHVFIVYGHCSSYSVEAAKCCLPYLLRFTKCPESISHSILDYLVNLGLIFSSRIIIIPS